MTNHKLGQILIPFILALVILACSGSSAVTTPALSTDTPVSPTATATATPVPISDLRVTDQREITIERANLLSLSPNGKWLAVEQESGELLCIYKTDTLTELSCARLETGPIDHLTFAWSPDSTQVAFSEKTGWESDIWTLEIMTGKLANLTEDNVVGHLISLTDQEQKDLSLDFAPTWSPDGQTFLFGRMAFLEEENNVPAILTTFYRIPISGGDPEKLFTISGETATAHTTILRWRWTSDGENILYTANSISDSVDGLWIIDKDGQNLHPITIPDLERWPILVNLSPRGDKALIFYGNDLGKPNISYFVLLDLETGQMKPIKQTYDGTDTNFFGPFNTVFSPDGSQILYVYRDTEGEFQLVVRDLESGAENILLTYEGRLGTTNGLGIGLNWAENNTIYAATSTADRPTYFNSGLLLSLGTE